MATKKVDNHKFEVVQRATVTVTATVTVHRIVKFPPSKVLVLCKFKTPVNDSFSSLSDIDWCVVSFAT